MEGEMSTAFVFRVEFQCKDCGKSENKKMRLHSFEEEKIDKKIGCKECKKTYGESHTPLLMYFYRDASRYDDDANTSVSIYVQRVVE
jgi:hypothetical protein